MDEQEILQELGAVMDQLTGLPKDAFAERIALLDRQAELRGLLEAAQKEAGRSAEELWSEQAARKKRDDHKPFVEVHLPDSSAGGVG